MFLLCVHSWKNASCDINVTRRALKVITFQKTLSRTIVMNIMIVKIFNFVSNVVWLFLSSIADVFFTNRNIDVINNYRSSIDVKEPLC